MTSLWSSVVVMMMNSLVINTVGSGENPALVHEGGSAHVQVLRLLQNCRLKFRITIRAKGEVKLSFKEILEGKKVVCYN